MSHYYLTRFEGSGTFLDPYRGIGCDQDRACILDLRPNGTVPDGAALLSLPIRRDRAEMEYLGEVVDEALSLAVRTRLGNLLSLSLASTRLTDIIAELWTRQRPLRPTPLGQLEIWLGGERVYAQSAIRGGASQSEDFDTADSTTLGPDQTWTEVDGDWSIVSNAINLVTPAGAIQHSARCEGVVTSADHAAQIDVTAGVTSGNWLGACARFAAAANTYYSCFIGDAGTIYLRRMEVGSETAITSAAQALSLPDTVKCHISSDQLSGYFNDVLTLGPTTDGNITGGVRGGVVGYGTADTNKGDNFVVADLAAGATNLSHGVLRGVRAGIYSGVL